jgi:hypothetical protein
MVVLSPDSNTLIIAISCAPALVKRNFDENGVINVQPDIVNEESLHLIKNFFFFLWRLTLVAIRQNESDMLVVALKNKFFKTSSVG